MTDLLVNFVHNLSLTVTILKNLLDRVVLAVSGLISIRSPNLGAEIMRRWFFTGLPQDNQRAAPFQRGQVTALEKMGLVIGGGHDKVLVKLTQIEQNTRRLAERLAPHASRSPGIRSDWGANYLQVVNMP